MRGGPKSRKSRKAANHKGQRDINRGSYGAVLARTHGNRHDHDFPTQLRCVSESIAQHVEAYGNLYQVKG